jgi:hypothetical protein
MAGEDQYASDTPAPDEALAEGDVDASLLDCTLRLTPAQRAERHYHARLFAQRLQNLAKARYGSAVDDLEASA